MKKILFILMGAVLVLQFSCAQAPKKEIVRVFYPPLHADKPRIQFLQSINSERDIGKESSEFVKFLTGEEEERSNIIMRPYDIAAVNGRIYISDIGLKKILILDLENKKFDIIKDKDEGEIIGLSGIWVTEDDIKYVADNARKKIIVFGKENEFIRTYGEEDQFLKPVDVAVYKDRIYVCDMLKHEVLVLDKDTGSTIQIIGGRGEDGGYFHRPTHVVVDSQGNLYVTDPLNFRIQKFDPEGKFVYAYGFQGDSYGAFAKPKGLAIDEENYLYAVDFAFQNVQIFDIETRVVLLFFGGMGNTPGSMNMPSSIYIDYNNLEYFQKYADKDFKLKYLLYVGNVWGDQKLNVYGFGDWTGELPEKEVSEEAGGEAVDEREAGEGEALIKNEDGSAKEKTE